FDHEDGAHVLRLEADGRLVYAVRTEDGTVAVQSPVLSAGSWHTVAGRVHQGALELYVNDTLVATEPAVSMVAFPAVPSDDAIVIGDGFTGRMSSLRFYDWNAQPLALLPNGGIEMDITIGSGGSESI